VKSRCSRGGVLEHSSVGVVRAFPRHFDMFMRTWNYGQAEVRARD
jgi:hypothetical protein